LSTAAERSGRTARPEEAVIPGLEVSLWERMLSPENLGRALRRVRANAGAPGADGMTTEELVPWLREHWAQVRQALDAGTYRPSPVRRVVIPKPAGGERLLGVPTYLPGQADLPGDRAGAHAGLRSGFLRVLVRVPSRPVRPPGGAGRAAVHRRRPGVGRRH